MRFQLVIKQSDDGSFKCKTAPMPTVKPAAAAETQVANPAKPKPNSERKTNSDTAKTQVPNSPTSVPVSAGETQVVSSAGDGGGNESATVMGGRTQNDDSSATAIAPQSKSVGGDSAASGRIGPYRLIRMLGQGGMGSVYLANQTSLDRNVALKVVKANLSKNKSMLARFTREAYAAAQLVHPNVVQIYDMGDDKGNCFFSMELVEGKSLHDLVGAGKKLDPEQAASYILHAARGLQCAHNAGMVHRDIKPANLLVNADGLVKVADLGLVKVADKEEIQDEIDAMSALSASTDLTRVGSTLGTPYYMAPEQAKSSINVDHRADIYSLGCTFYVLLTGKRPFEGNSIQEVVSKHTSAPLVVPSRIVERVPESLSAFVAKMMAKRPDDRYQDIGDLIVDLEKYLGVATTEAFTPDENDAVTIETCATSFNSPPVAKLRSILPLVLVAGAMLIAVLMLYAGWRWATGFALMPLFAVATYFLISGFKDRPVLFDRCRELVLRSGVLNWIKWIAAALLLVVASFLVGAFGHWLILGIVGAGLGAGYYFAIDGPLASKRKSSIISAEKLLRKMRIKGMDESTIQMFVAKYCGDHWEEFFESLFGYEAKRRVRDEIAKSEVGKKKPKFRAWRDGIYNNLNQRLEEMNNVDERSHLQKVEAAGLQEQGISPSDAKEQAAQMAAALVDHGDSIRVQALQRRILELDPEAQRLKQRLKVKAMLAEARSGKYKKQQTSIEKMTPMLNRILGSYTRFLLGCCLIVGCLLWARQNDLLEQLKETAVSAQNAMSAVQNEDGTPSDVKDVASASANKIMESFNVETEALSFPILGGLFYNFNSLIAGLVLVCSAIVFGWRMSVFVLPAAAITLLGAWFGIPAVFPIPHVHALSALIGIGLLVLGIVFGRAED
ncbi:MAG: protein kinase [Mariniblastus sp.]